MMGTLLLLGVMAIGVVLGFFTSAIFAEDEYYAADAWDDCDPDEDEDDAA